MAFVKDRILLLHLFWFRAFQNVKCDGWVLHANIKAFGIKHFIQLLGQMKENTKDNKSGAFLAWRIEITIKRGNTASPMISLT